MNSISQLHLGWRKPCIIIHCLFQPARLRRGPDGGPLPGRHPRPPRGGQDDAGQRARQGGQEHRRDQARSHAAAATAVGEMSVRCIHCMKGINPGYHFWVLTLPSLVNTNFSTKANSFLYHSKVHRKGMHALVMIDRAVQGILIYDSSTNF